MLNVSQKLFGRTTRYGMDGPGIESRPRDYPHKSRPALGPTQPPVETVPGHFLGWFKRKGRGVDHPLSFIAEVQEWVEL
jgi:hypothetical protein